MWRQKKRRTEKKDKENCQEEKERKRDLESLGENDNSTHFMSRRLIATICSCRLRRRRRRRHCCRLCRCRRLRLFKNLVWLKNRHLLSVLISLNSQMLISKVKNKVIFAR